MAVGVGGNSEGDGGRGGAYIQMLPPWTPAANVLPSALEASPHQLYVDVKDVSSNHVTPDASVSDTAVQILPGSAEATTLRPSDEEAIDFQNPVVDACSVQAQPPADDKYPLHRLPLYTATRTALQSSEQAIACQPR